MDFDVIVLGSGPGGYVAAIRASQLGMKTAIIEKESLGGICLNWGCIPTKALLKSAQVFEYINNSEEFGISISNPSANFEKIIKRSRGVADKMSKGINFLMKKNKIKVINGFGKLVKNNSIEVTDTDDKKSTYTGKNIIIATGARSRQLPNLKQDNKNIFGYRKAMTLEKKPKSIIIVGSGAIGVEFAYFFNSVGTKVTIVEYQKNIVPNEDNDVSRELYKIFKNKGIEILTDSSVVSAIYKDGEVHAEISKEGTKTIIKAEKLLSAVGIQSNIENIGLEEININTENGKISVNEFYETNVPNHYAIGDVVSGPALAHVASAEGIICVEKIANLKPEVIDYNNIPGCTYCSPEIASVGMTEKEAKSNGYEVKVGKFPFSASGKASAAGKNYGFVKLIFDSKYGELIGAHMIGYNVTEMIAEIVAIRKLETTAHELIKTIHPHPTMSEAIMEAAAAAYDEVIHL
tara:strand:+ start:4912 stop:6300 length:1389 start_codon:yes stop_codon:yes gene_type:complete